MRIFFISLRVPFPPDRGDKIATFNLVRHLSEEHEVHVFCLGEGRADASNVAKLAEFVGSVTAIQRSRLLNKWRGGKAFFTGAPLSVALVDEPQMHAAVTAAHARLSPDLIIVYSGNAAQFAANLTGTPRISYLSDLDSRKWLKYAERHSFPLSWLYRRESERLLQHERRLAESFSHSVVCTATEKSDFERLMPKAAVDVLPNGVDLETFTSQGRPKIPGRMVFTGVMDYFPNVDGADWFCNTVLPRIRQQVPHATFVICGQRPAGKIRRLARRSEVSVTGAVPDVRPYLDEAEICVVPVRVGRGLQNKLLEGLAMGLPCISCGCSWNATVIEQGEGVLVADDATGFAGHAVRLLRDHRYRAEMGRRARAVVETHYTWQQQFRRLDQIIQQVVTDNQERLQGRITETTPGYLDHLEKGRCRECIPAT